MDDKSQYVLSVITIWYVNVKCYVHMTWCARLWRTDSSPTVDTATVADGNSRVHLLRYPVEDLGKKYNFSSANYSVVTGVYRV